MSKLLPWSGWLLFCSSWPSLNHFYWPFLTLAGDERIPPFPLWLMSKWFSHWASWPDWDPLTGTPTRNYSRLHLLIRNSTPPSPLALLYKFNFHPDKLMRLKCPIGFYHVKIAKLRQWPNAVESPRKGSVIIPRWCFNCFKSQSFCMVLQVQAGLSQCKKSNS